MTAEIAPKFDENAWYPIGYAARQLGISRASLLRAAKLGRKRNGIDFKIGLNGRKKFLGRELLRYYTEM